MARLFKRDNSSKWYLCFTDENGRLQRKAGSIDKKKSQALLDEIVGNVQRKKLGLEPIKTDKPQKYILTADLIVAEYCDYIKPVVRKSTHKGQCSILVNMFIQQSMRTQKHDEQPLPPQLKVKYLGDLSEPIINKWREAQTKLGYTISTLRLRYRILQSLLKFAVKKHYIASNPIDKYNPFPKEHNQVEELPTQEQWDTVINTLSPQTRAFMQFMRLTGMRLMEAFSTQVKDCRLNEKSPFLIISSERSKTYSARNVSLIPRAIALLKPFLLKHDGTPKADSSLVFDKLDGSTRPEYAVTRNVRNAVKKCKIPVRFVVHTTRALFIVDCLKAGISNVLIAKQVGHNSLDMIMTYANANPDDMAEHFKKLG